MSMYGENAKSSLYDDIKYLLNEGSITFVDLLDINRDIYKNEIGGTYESNGEKWQSRYTCW